MVDALRQLIRPLVQEAVPGRRWCFPVGALLAWSGVAWVLLPLLPGLIKVLMPALSPLVWQTLWSDNQFVPAVLLTLFSAFGSTVLALILAVGWVIWSYPGKGWQGIRRQLPVLLAFPHAAFAIGLGFLVTPSGWLARWLAFVLDWAAPPQWVTVQDPYALSLLLALALKESWFLLWVLLALLGEQHLLRQIAVARSLGYGRRQIGWRILLPQVLPRLGWPLLAVLAYGLSVVDMALILGPSTPPTLAVLGWQWFVDPQAEMQAKGSAVALLLMGLLLLGAGLGRLGLAVLRRCWAEPEGVRAIVSPSETRFLTSSSLIFVAGWLALGMLLLWSVADSWFFPAIWPQSLGLGGWVQADLIPLWTTLWLGVLTVLIALPLALLWLEWGPRWHGWLYAPLILPALPLAAAQYQVLLFLNLDNTAAAVVWSHLAWVLPYMVLVLAGAYQAFDRRYLITAQALGYSRWRACWSVKWPVLWRPILAALAVGFAVSVAQYLPTLFAGGGRIETVTTEAVALSAGGNRRVLAVQALLQALLPMLAFALAGLSGWVYVRKWQGLR